MRQIAENGGFEGSVIVHKVKEAENGFGFNAQTGEFGDLLEQGIIDPTKVTRLALQHAASLAGTLITTETVITDRFKKPPSVGVNPHATIPGLQSHMANRAAMGADVMDEMLEEEIDAL